MPAIRICRDNTRTNGQLKTVQGFLKLRFCGFGVEWQVLADIGDAGAKFIEAVEPDHAHINRAGRRALQVPVSGPAVPVRTRPP